MPTALLSRRFQPPFFPGKKESWGGAGDELTMAMLLRLLVAALVVACSDAFVMPAAGAAQLVARPAALSPSLAPVSMTSVNKKAKAACRKQKTSKAAKKRFKATSTGKLLRHYAGKAHLLRKKRPQKLASLRRVGAVADAELKTYQKLVGIEGKK